MFITATEALSWRSNACYQFCYYSERHTMSSNRHHVTAHQTLLRLSDEQPLARKGSLAPGADLTLKGTVNNLF